MPLSPYIIFAVLFWRHSTTLISCYIVEHRMTHSIQGETATLLNTLGESHLLISIMHSSVVCAPECQDALLTDIKPTVDQHTQIPFCRATLKPLNYQSVLVPRITVSQVKNPAFIFVEFHAIDDCSVFNCLMNTSHTNNSCPLSFLQTTRSIIWATNQNSFFYYFLNLMITSLSK